MVSGSEDPILVKSQCDSDDLEKSLPVTEPKVRGNAREGLWLFPALGLQSAA